VVLREARDERYAVDVGAGSEDAVRRWLAGRTQARQSALLVYEREGQIDGFACVSVAERPPPFRAPRRGELEHLFVRPERRRHGIGRALVDACEAWLRTQGADRMALQVSGANTEGQAFWRALGFAHSMDVLDRSL